MALHVSKEGRSALPFSCSQHTVRHSVLSGSLPMPLSLSLTLPPAAACTGASCGTAAGGGAAAAGLALCALGFLAAGRAPPLRPLLTRPVPTSRRLLQVPASCSSLSWPSLKSSTASQASRLGS